MTAVNLNATGNIGQIVQNVPTAKTATRNDASKTDFGQVMKEKAGERAGNSQLKAEDAIKQPTRTELKESSSSKAKVLTKQKEQPVPDKKGKVEETAEELLAGAAEVLGITPEELKQILDTMELGIGDLADRNNVAQLILMLNGSDDVSDMLIDNGMLETFNELNDFIAETLDQAGIPAEEFKSLLESAGVSPAQVQENTLAEEDNGIDTDEEGSAYDETRGLAQNENKGPEVVVEKQDGGEETGSALTEKTEDETSLKDSGKPTIETNPAENFVRHLEMAVNETAEVEGNVPDVREIVYQVVERIRVSISPENTSMEMHLNPENLGRVSINITSKAGVMTAQINTENRQAREAIESQLQILKENIEAKGIRVEAVEVRISDFNLADSRNSESSSENREENGSGNRRRNGNLDVTATDDTTEVERLAREVLADTGSTVSYTA